MTITLTNIKIRCDKNMHESVTAIEAMLSGGLGVAVLGWIVQGIKSSRDKKETKLEHMEDKLIELDKSIVRLDDSNKRVHLRLDATEASQNKLETKIDSDIQDVKRSIEKLSDIVIQAVQHRGGA